MFYFLLLLGEYVYLTPLSYNMSDAPLTVWSAIARNTHKKSTMTGCMDRKRVWSASLLLFNSPFPQLFWTTRLSLSDVALYCKKHIISRRAPFVYMWGFCACAHVCLRGSFSQSRRGAETEGGGVATSTSANWILPKRDSDEVLFIEAVIVSIFTPVHEY